MATSIGLWKLQGKTRISKRARFAIAGAFVAVTTTLGVVSVAGDNNAQQMTSASTVRHADQQQPIIYVVQSVDRARAISQWHMADADLSHAPFSTFVAGTAHHGAAPERFRRDVVLFAAQGGDQGPDVQDLR